MGIDAQRLEQLRRYEDPVSGISEEFLAGRLGTGGTLGLLSTPLGARRTDAWIVCPSIGPEHGNLRRLEAIVARRLAAAGFPVLRIRPDVHPLDGLRGEIDLGARLAEVEDGVRLTIAETGAQAVGAIGPFFGGTVAALACEQLGLASMLLIEPLPRGKQYLREVMRRHAVAELVGADGAQDADGVQDAPAAAAPKRQLEATGSTAVQGLRLSRAAAERITAVELTEDLMSFRGRSLLIGISSHGKLSPGLRALRDHLAALGGDVTATAIEDALFAPFGEYYYRNAGPVRLDTRLRLDERLADAAVSWALGSEAAERPGAIT